MCVAGFLSGPAREKTTGASSPDDVGVSPRWGMPVKDRWIVAIGASPYIVQLSSPLRYVGV